MPRYSGGSLSHNFLLVFLFLKRVLRFALCLVRSHNMTALLAIVSNRMPLRWGWLSLSTHVSYFLLRLSLHWPPFPLRLPPHILCLHLLPIHWPCSPFMRYFPHSELSILTWCKENVFILVVVNHFYLFSEGTLHLDYAFTFLFNVSNF